MSICSNIKLTEIFVQFRTKQISLDNYEEYAKQITSVISKPSQNLNISNVSSDTVIPAGAYYVPNDITVVAGAELVIEPGVILYFAQGTGIESYGKLTVIGSPDNLIIFSGDKWANISIIGKSSKNTTFQYVIIEGGHSRSLVPTYGETFRSCNDAPLGGNLYVENSHLKMTNCFILNGNAGHGGGMFIYQSSIEVEDIIVFNNKDKYLAAGVVLFGIIKNNKSPSIFKNSFVIKNSGFYSGGICVEGGNIILDNLVVKHNFSKAATGGISINKGKDDHFYISLKNSLIEDNFGVTCGGLSYGGSQPIIEDIITNVIKNNSNTSGQSPNIKQYFRS